MTDQDDARNIAEWANPANWRGPLGIYYAPRDTRTLVPKRNPAFGWTLNAARPLGLVAVILCLAVVVFAVGMALRDGTTR